MRNFAAVLLAGGRSTRMGASKALLDCQGTPLWRLQMEKLAQLNADELFFSVQSDAEFPSGSWTFVHDRSVYLGPIGGLQAALRRTREEYLVTLAVDMPAMTTEFLTSMLAKAGPAGIVPRLDGFYHGTCAVYPTNILPLVEQVLTSNDRSFQNLISKALRSGLMKVEEIKPAAKALFENWNYPHDVLRDSFPAGEAA
jgi:molybdopterin-guanine dinucleotide biosynthesis protein A